jgi:CRISPR/Cas system-associated exonuclease Cas4 (RecB family)
MKEISPSMLPKLASCPVFVGAGGASLAAERGTKMDGIIRAAFGAEVKDSKIIELDSDDLVACEWGVATLQKLASGHPIETREEYLQMDVPGLSRPGTADAVCVGARWVADVKTGQIRNYREQLAAYALACMNATWEDKWTAHVVYVDQQAVRSYEFTREQCERIVQDVTGMATSPLAQPVPCEYCDWCANKDRCKALVLQSKAALADISATNADTLTIIRDRILADPAKHSDFVARFKWFVKEFGDPLTDALKERLQAGEEIDGWKLTNAAQRRYVEPADVIPVISKVSPEQVYFATGGKISPDKFLELAASVGVEDAEKLVKSAPGTPQMRQVKKKEK